MRTIAFQRRGPLERAITSATYHSPAAPTPDDRLATKGIAGSGTTGAIALATQGRKLPVSAGASVLRYPQ